MVARGGEVAMQDGTFDYDYSGSDNLNEVAWYNDFQTVGKFLRHHFL